MYKLVSLSSPAENAVVEFSQHGPRTIITIKQIVRNSGNDGEDKQVTTVSVPTADLAIVAQVFSS